jgi:hypothetical protein
MIATRRPGVRRRDRPGDRSCASGRFHGLDAQVRLLAARRLVNSAMRLLRLVERAYRAGLLDLGRVEYSVCISAKLRGCARCLVGASAASADPPKLAPPVRAPGS